jgi:hypothetical protein
LYRGDSLVGVVERSRMMPWRWWWSVWDENTQATDDTHLLAKAKAAAVRALQGEAVRG